MMQRSTHPIVSVLAPCFNEESALPAFIESLLNQKYQNFELVIFDNASKDSSREIIQSYEQLDDRVRLVSYEDHVDGFRQWRRLRSYPCKSPFISVRSCNDSIDHNYLGECIGLLLSDESIGLVYSHGYLKESITGEVIAASSESRIDTRGLSLRESVYQVVSRYTYSFPLWGVYKKSVFNQIDMQYNYGQDHILVCEASIYGKVVPLVEKLDTRLQNSQEDLFSGIKKMWFGNHALIGRGVSETSFFMTPDIFLPFTSMISGHLRMISGAMTPEENKPDLQRIAFDVLCTRFRQLLDHEHSMFLHVFKSNDLRQIVSCNLSWKSAFVASLFEIAQISPSRREDCRSLLMDL